MNKPSQETLEKWHKDPANWKMGSITTKKITDCFRLNVLLGWAGQ